VIRRGRRAQDPRVVANVTRLATLARSGESPARACAAPEGAALAELLEPALRACGAA